MGEYISIEKTSCNSENSTRATPPKITATTTTSNSRVLPTLPTTCFNYISLGENIKFAGGFNTGKKEPQFYIWRDAKYRKHIFELSSSDFSNIVESGQRFLNILEQYNRIVFKKQSRLKNWGRIINEKLKTKPVEISSKFWNCKKCDSVFLNSKQLKIHSYIHDEQYKRLCETCGKLVNTKYFAIHKIMHKKDE